MERRHFLGGLAVSAWPRSLAHAQQADQTQEPDRVFDVRRFGALGDGRTDDTAAIGRAVAEVAKAGGIVHLPAGDYLVSGPLTLPASRVWHLRGAGRELSRLRIGGSGSACDLVSSVQGHRRSEFGCSIEELTLDGGGLPGTLVRLVDHSLLSLRRLYLTRAAGSGLVLEGLWDSILDDVFVEGCGTASSPAVVCRSPESPANDSMNNCIFVDLHTETHADTIHLDVAGSALNRTDTLQFFGLKCHGDPGTGRPALPLIRLDRYTIGCSFISGIIAWGNGTSQVEVDGQRNKFIGPDHGIGPRGHGPAFAYHFTANAVGNEVAMANFKNGVGEDVYRSGYMRVEPGARNNKLLFPQMSTGPEPLARVLSDDGRGTLFLGDDINDAGGLYLRHGLGFSPMLTRGISGTSTVARNLRGSVTIEGTSSQADVRLPAVEDDDAYFVTCTVAAVRGRAAGGAHRVWLTDKTAKGFRVRCEEPPGSGSAVTVDWILMR